MNRPRLPDEDPALGDVKLVRRLGGGGGWNETWLAARGEERLVVRFDTPAVRRLGLDRAAEARVLRSVQGRELGPELVFADPRRGLLVTRWLPGRTCATAMLRSPHILRALGFSLRRLHETVAPPSAAASLDLARTLADYATAVGGVRARTAARSGVRSLKAAAGSRRSPALCHNDPVIQNVLLGHSLRLIDWEFAAPGDPLFDLAVVVGHHDLPAEPARILLAAARGRVRTSEWRALTHLVNSYRHLRALWEALTAKCLPLRRRQTGAIAGYVSRNR
ncbi:MAG: phosphotransferase [Gammaproteobacteria bacterium]|nr:phosphotransferase [Gammaproteobacteria bacterium]